MASILERFGITDPKKEKETASEASDARLQKLEQDLSAATQRIEDLLRAGPQRVVVETPGRRDDAPQSGPAVDLSGLPDPMDDFEKYQTALADRINKNMTEREVALTRSIAENLSAADQAEAESAAQAQQLEAYYDEHYKDRGYPKSVVRAAAYELIEEGQRAGRDMENYVMRSKDKFFADVVSRVEGWMPKGSDEGEGEGSEKPPMLPDPFAEMRTAGIAGGVEAGGKPTKGRGGKPEGSSDFIEDLQNLQKVDGHF